MAILVVAYNIVSGQWWAERKRRALQEQFLKRYKEEEFLRLLQEYSLSSRVQEARDICASTGVALLLETTKVSYGFNGQDFFIGRERNLQFEPRPISFSEFARAWVDHYSSAEAAFQALVGQLNNGTEDLVAKKIPANLLVPEKARFGDKDTVVTNP